MVRCNLLRHRVDMVGQEVQLFNQLMNSPRKRQLDNASLNRALTYPYRALDLRGIQDSIQDLLRLYSRSIKELLRLK